MTFTLHEYPAQPSTDTQVLGGPDFNPFAPRRIYEVTVNPYVYLNAQVFHAHYSMTDEQLRRYPRAREDTEEMAKQSLRRTVERYVNQLTPTVEGFEPAARAAPDKLEMWQHVLVDQIVRHATGRWEREAVADGYTVRAELTSAHWAAAANFYNSRNQYTRTQLVWGGDFGQTGSSATVITMTATMNNTTAFPVWNAYVQPAYTTVVNQQTWDQIQQYQQQILGQWQTPMTTMQSWDSNRGTPVDPAAQERARRRRLKRDRDRTLAERRGRKLLLSLLDEEQMREYASSSTFRVTAADGREFRLRKGRTAELLAASSGDVEASYCIHLYSQGGYTFVPEDTLISQMLLLQTDPQEFEKISNITPMRRPRPVPADLALQAAHLRERNREAEAMLRAEGIEDPRAWDEALRAQVRANNIRPEDWLPHAVDDRRGLIAQAVVEDEIAQLNQPQEAEAA